MPDQRAEIIEFIRKSGPILPVQLSKHINTNILFASAMLSELFSTRQLKMTHASIGGSPLYYLQGQEAQTDERLSASLSGKEKEIYNLLKDKKVLREKDLIPWQRVAIGDLKDFAVSISAKHEENIENFWKHHLISDEEAKKIISVVMTELYGSQKIVQEISSTIKNTNPHFSEIQRQIQPIDNKILSSMELAKDTNKKTVQERTEQVPLKKKIKIKSESYKNENEFYNEVINFMKNNQVFILKEEIIKKEKEFDFIVNIPSSFGKLKYFIKAKNKATINDADVSVAFSEGQIRKIPVILLINGKLTKKAALLVEQKMQGQLIIKEFNEKLK